MKKLVVVLFACVCLIPAAAPSADIEAGQAKSAVCAGCHGADGNSVNPQWPKLAGQYSKYIYKQLRDFKRKARVNVIMNAQAADLSDQDMRNLAAYFSAQAISPSTSDVQKLRLGETIYRGGVAARGVPACTGCHHPAGIGNAAAVFPKLSYQHAPYVANQLRAFRSGKRANDPAGMMRTIAGRLTDREINAVAQYISGLHQAP
jgi:cytochrome c553